MKTNKEHTAADCIKNCLPKVKAMPVYRVYDWTGRELTDFGTFSDFDEAWAAIYAKFPNEDNFDDYYVLTEKENMGGK